MIDYKKEARLFLADAQWFEEYYDPNGFIREEAEVGEPLDTKWARNHVDGLSWAFDEPLDPRVTPEFLLHYVAAIRAADDAD